MSRRTLQALAMMTIVAVPAAAVAGSLDGRYAFFQGRTAAEQDRGPQTDQDCRDFLSSARYEGEAAEILTIRQGRWDDNQDVSAVTGNVILGETRGGRTAIVIDLESEGLDGQPVRGFVERRTGNAITIALQSLPHVLHYCKLP